MKSSEVRRRPPPNHGARLCLLAIPCAAWWLTTPVNKIEDSGPVLGPHTGARVEQPPGAQHGPRHLPQLSPPSLFAISGETSGVVRSCAITRRS